MDKHASGARISALVTIMLLLPALLANISVGPARAAVGNPWYIKTVATERQSIYDMAIGEFDPNCPGMEIVVTGGAGIVNEYCSQTFHVKPLFQALRTQEGVAIGDVDSRYKGNEVLSVGLDGLVHVLHREANGAWVSETVWDSNGLINGVTVGEFNATHPGLEIALAIDNAHFAILNQDPKVPGGWAVFRLTVQQVPITNMMVYSADIIPDYIGDEILLGSFSGDLFMIRWDAPNATWNITSIWRADYAILGVGFGADVVPEIPGPELYVSQLFGNVTMLYLNGTKWMNQTVYHDKTNNPVYMSLPVDVDPRYPGPEVVSVGISPNLHVSRYSDGNWTTEEIVDPTGQDRLKLLYDLDVGELDGTHPGPEMIVGGINQNLVSIEFTEPTFQLVPIIEEQTVVWGQRADFWISVVSIGYFPGQVALTSVPGVTFSKTKASPGDLVKVSVLTSAFTMEAYPSINVTGTALELDQTKTVILYLFGKSSTTPGISLEVLPDVQTTMPGFKATFMVKSTAINSWPHPTIHYSIGTMLPFTTSLTWDQTSQDMPIATLTMEPSSFALNGSYPFIIHCTAWDNTTISWFETDTVATINIDSRGLPDFSVAAAPLASIGVPNSTLRFDLTLNPLDDFTDPVTISVDGVPKGAKGTFAVMLVNPPSKLTYYLELGPSVAPGNSILMFKATGGGWTHTALTQLSIVKASRYGDYGLSISPPVQMVAPGTSAYFLLHVTGNYGPDGLEIRASGAPFSASISAGQGGNPEYELLTVSVRKDAAPGVYKGLVVGTSPWEHNASFMVIVSSGGPDIDLTLELKDILTSPGQDWPTLRLNATTGLSLVTNKTLTYRTLGLGILGTSELFNYDLSKDLILPIGNLKAATYLYLLLVQTPDMTYPKVLVGTLTMTAPVALLYINVAEDHWTYQEGDHNTVQVWATNTGKASSGPLDIEVLLDGKSLCRRSVGPVIAGGKSEILNCTVPAVAGEHNITYLIQLQDASLGRVMSPSMTEHYKVHGFGMTGPLIAILLLLFAVGLLGVAIKMRTQEPKTNKAGPKYKDEEE
jgi:hypothetical protein